VFGPTLLSSGPKIEGIKPIWKGTLETGSEADVDKALDQLKTLGVDFVKITDSTLEPKLFLYAVRQAHAAGLRTSGHIPMAITVRQAVDAGLSSIEHLGYAFNAGVRDEAAIAADFGSGRITRVEATARLDAGFDRETAMSAYRYLAHKGVSVTPTLNGSRVIALLDRDDHQHDAYLAYIGPGLTKTYEWRVQRAPGQREQIAQRHAHYEHVAAVLPLLQEAGVTIMAGTDAGFLNSFKLSGHRPARRAGALCGARPDPAQALSAATRAGPAWFGLLDRYGSVETGKAADLVLLDRNPLEDIRATRAIRTVILRGSDPGPGGARPHAGRRAREGRGLERRGAMSGCGSFSTTKIRLGAGNRRRLARAGTEPVPNRLAESLGQDSSVVSPDLDRRVPLTTLYVSVTPVRRPLRPRSILRSSLSACLQDAGIGDRIVGAIVQWRTAFETSTSPPSAENLTCLTSLSHRPPVLLISTLGLVALSAC
jgi:hypothetical protein